MVDSSVLFAGLDQLCSIPIPIPVVVIVSGSLEFFCQLRVALEGQFDIIWVILNCQYRQVNHRSSFVRGNHPSFHSVTIHSIAVGGIRVQTPYVSHTGIRRFPSSGQWLCNLPSSQRIVANITKTNFGSSQLTINVLSLYREAPTDALCNISR
eukprot:scaffold23051_cov36-Cyclotella_meneghiniana.AAC.1